MAMEEVLDSVKRMVERWTATNAPLLSSASPGDTVLNINTTKRFRVGDEVLIRTPTSAETPLTVKSIVDSTHLELDSAIQFYWDVNESPILEKTFFQNFVQQVYLGEPDNIPRFPAITIKAVSADSEWLTLDSTKESYQVELSVYVLSGNQEDTYRYLMRVTDTIREGLKNNIFPLVGPYQTTSLTADAALADIYLKVADSSIFNIPDQQRILIEDLYKSEENRIEEVIDSTTVKLLEPTSCSYNVADGAKIINTTRFIYNSWPDSTQYGTIFKGSMLKAATISWFAWEEQVQPEFPIDTNLT